MLRIALALPPPKARPSTVKLPKVTGWPADKTPTANKYTLLQAYAIKCLG